MDIWTGSTSWLLLSPVAMNMLVHLFIRIPAFNFSYMLRGEIVGSCGDSTFKFGGTYQTVLCALRYLTFPLTVYEGSNSSTYLLSLFVTYIFKKASSECK